ncbi:hypothetical protein BV898_10063 [Hypsibius exemplaris]|uniref:G-protein coupled receptors family 1 profile domain-containing protein n=1 Tax=Hypsibius exemplaris TaxID=2072580 RepID=A0A1W0WKS1_HYPEX|nr:hypothetical protein BV898_10063 [Hypsibius exemplaris]
MNWTSNFSLTDMIGRDGASVNRSTSSSPLSYGKYVELMLWIGLTASISFLGLLLNLAGLTVTFWKRTAESIFNLLMSHYVAISLVNCLVNFPVHVFMVLAKWYGHSIPPDACRTIQFFFAFGCAVSNWADVCLSVNRFVAIVFPLHYRWWTQRSVNLAMVAFGWLLCAAAILPLSFGLGGSMPLLRTGQCGFLPVGKWGMLVTSITAYIPYGIIAGTSLTIWMKIITVQRARNQVQAVDGSHAIKPMGISRRRLVVARMLLMTTVWSALCNIPWGVIQFSFPGLYVTDPISVLWLRTVQVLQFGAFPVILYATNEDYRKRFFVLLARSGAKKRVLIRSLNSTVGAPLEMASNLAGKSARLVDGD